MRQSVRGLMAALGGLVLALSTIGAATAAPSEAEAQAILAFRGQLVEALQDAKARLVEYRAYRDEPRWYVLEGGWGYVDVKRLHDYVPIARYIEEHPDILATLRADPFWLDATLIASVTLLTEEAKSSSDVRRAAERLTARLRQTTDEKAGYTRPYLQDAREERELTITAIDTLDALIEGLGLPATGPAADDVRVEPAPEPGPGTSGVMAAFREQLSADLDRARRRIRDCREWIKDPDAYIHDSLDVTGFDLARLADYESAVEFMRDNVWAWAILDAPAAKYSDLDVATSLYLETFERVPDDLSKITARVVEAKRQTSKRKRNDHCVEVLGGGVRYRDALVNALAAADQISAALGLTLEPTPSLMPPTPTLPPTATPQPTASPQPTATPEPMETPQPTATPEPMGTPQPTPTPEPPPAETPVPDPFADL